MSRTPVAVSVVVVVVGVLALGADPIGTIHIVAHSHCDPGWLETYETYFRDDVRAILTNVVTELRRRPERRFVWSEISFFRLWYDELSEEDRQQFQKLLDSGQFEFVNGGWVQNDEACPHYSDIISQITQGHTYLYDRFGIRPRFGWQIDPFGHSAVTPALFRLLGYEAAVINRIDFRLKAALKQHGLMEFLWRGVDLGHQADLFTHVLHTHYSAPQGYDWEGGSEPIHDFNIERRAKEFVEAMRERMSAFQTTELLVPFGDDFKFKNAVIQFSNMDRLIDHINSHSEQYQIQIRYSTLSEYFQAVSHANATFPTLCGDFFPYADNGNSFWTGFYTTRPQLKRISRAVSAQLRAADMMFVMALAELTPNVTEPMYENLVEAWRNAALFLHHDAITGTARENVVLDYTERMQSAHDKATHIIEDLTARLIALPDIQDEEFGLERDSSTLSPGSYAISVLNSISWSRTELVCRSISSQFVQVRDVKGNVIRTAQVYAHWTADTGTDPGAIPSEYRVCFRAQLSALSITVFTLDVYERKPDQTISIAELSVVQVLSRADVIGHDSNAIQFVNLQDNNEVGQLLHLGNDIVEVELSPVTGLIASILDKVSGRTVRAEHELAQYTTSSSGAYIFRPDVGPQPIPEITKAEPIIRIVRGTVLSAVTVHLGTYIVQTRIATGCADIDVRIHAHAEDNREIVTRWRTSIESADEFFSTNGIEFVKRRRHDMDPISANFYPAVTGAQISDSEMEFTVLTGHTSGVASPDSGVLEFLIHRRLLQDDGRGLSQAIMDRSKIPVTMRLRVQKSGQQSTHHHRQAAVEIDTPLIILKAKARTPVRDWHTVLASRKFLQKFPEQVHMLSLGPRSDSSSEVLIRLENMHDSGPSIQVSLKNLCLTFRSGVCIATIRDVRETTLSSIQDLTEVSRAGGALAFAPSGLVLPISLDTLTSPELDLRQAQQNTDEEGVFISDVALEKAVVASDLDPLQRRLLSNLDLDILQLESHQLRTFIVVLERHPDPSNRIVIPDSNEWSQTQRIVSHLPGRFEVMAVGLLSTTILIAALLLAKYSSGLFVMKGSMAQQYLANKLERHVV